MTYTITAKWAGTEDGIVTQRVRHIMNRRGEWKSGQKIDGQTAFSVTVPVEDTEIGAFLGALRNLPGVDAELIREK